MEIVNIKQLAPEGSKVDSKKEKNLDKLYKAMTQKQIVKMKIIQVRRTELESGAAYFWKLEFEGIHGLMKFEDTGLKHEKQMQQYVGQEIFFQLKKVNRNPAYFLGDRKSALKVLEDQVFEQLKEGMVIESIVKGIGSTDIYVDIGGGYTVGLNRKDATLSSAPKSLRNFFKIGQPLKVKILEISKKKRVVKISHTALLEDPWKTYKISRKDIVLGEIVGITKQNTIFVEIEQGLDGIVTLPDIPIDLKVGDFIQCSVTKFSPEEKKFRLRFVNKID